MAFTLTRNLKLRVDSNLTANSKYNLERLDLLGASLQVDSTNSVNFRSQGGITIEPNSADVGGTGIGGVLNLGTSSHTLDEINLYADSINLGGEIWPSADGNAGQVLATDGAGNLYWVSIATGSGDVRGAEATWTTANGTTKTVIHGLGSTAVDVTLVDLSDNQLIGVNTITVTDSNTITLNASEAPSASGWRIVIQAK